MNSTFAWLVTAMAAFIIGLGKGGLGGMVGTFVTALVALVLPPDQVLGVVLPLLIAGDFFAVMVHWRRWDWSIIIQLVPGAILGVLIATYFLSQLSGEGIRITLAVIVLIFVFLKSLEGWLLNQFQYRPRRGHGWFAGVVSGITSTLAHGGGPPVSIFLLLQAMKPETFAATAAFFFFVVNWVKVPSYLAAGIFDWPLIRSMLWILPLVPLGIWTGKWSVTRVGRGSFEKVVLFLLAVSGILLLVR